MHTVFRSLRVHWAVLLTPLLAALLPIALPAAQPEVVDLGMWGREDGEDSVLYIEPLGPPLDVVPARVEDRLSFLFAGRSVDAAWPWGPLPPLVERATLEEADRGSRLVLDLAPTVGRVRLEPLEGGLRVVLHEGPRPRMQAFRPLRLKPFDRDDPRATTRSADEIVPEPDVPEPPSPQPGPPPGPAPVAEGPDAVVQPSPEGPGEAAPDTEPPPAPELAESEPARESIAPTRAEPSPPELPDPAAETLPAESAPHPGWGLRATETGLELRLIPMRGRTGWEDLPPEIRRAYAVFVSLARVAEESPYIFRFRQRPGRFVLLLEDGREVASLDLRGRDYLLALSTGDPEALFDELDLFPGTEHAGLVVFPDTFDLEEITRAKVRIRGELHDLPPIQPSPAD